MAVFMATDLEIMLKALKYKFMMKDVLDGANTAKLARMDLYKKEDMLSVKKINVGFASRAIIWRKTRKYRN